MVHELKILPEYFMPVILGKKAFEVRKDDRPFSVGDMLLLREYRNGEYTGNAIKAEITYILRGEYCKEGYCILGVKRVLNEATVFSACFLERITLREFMNRVQKGECKARRHGRWIPTEYDGYADGNPVYDVFECSECGHEHKGEEDTLTAFCPDCGARMDADANESMFADTFSQCDNCPDWDDEKGCKSHGKGCEDGGADNG